jgi:hypothetical protein
LVLPASIANTNPSVTMPFGPYEFAIIYTPNLLLCALKFFETSVAVIALS